MTSPAPDATATAAAPVATASAAPPVRLTLLDREDATSTTLDGGWWPHSASLSDGLPALVEELSRRDLRVTTVSYNPALWDAAPGKMRVDGHTVHLGWFASIDPHEVTLAGLSGTDPAPRRLVMLVVPPQAADGPAARAMASAAATGNHARPTAVLTETGVLTGSGVLAARPAGSGADGTP